MQNPTHSNQPPRLLSGWPEPPRKKQSPALHCGAKVRAGLWEVRTAIAEMSCSGT
jgi:hypothetical protein